MFDPNTITHLFKAAPTACIILFPDVSSFEITWVNPSCIDLMGIEIKETIGLSVFEIFEDCIQVSEIGKNNTLQHALEHCLNSKCAAKPEIQRYIFAVGQIVNGQSTALACSVYPLLDEEENVTFIVLNLELTKTPFPAKPNPSPAHYKKLSNMLESISDGFFAINNACEVTYWNTTAERIFQINAADVLGNCLWDTHSEFSNSVFQSAYKKSTEENNDIHTESFFASQNLWLEISTFQFDEGISFYFKDITKRKQQEEKLTKVKKQYQGFFESSPLPQFVFGVGDLRFKDVNEAAITHYGYTKAEFLSMTILDIRPKEDIPLMQHILREKLQKGLYHKGIFRHIKKSGDIIDVQVAGNSIVFEGESARLVLALDVTEKLSAQVALKGSEQRFKALIQDGSDLIGILDGKGDYLYVNQTSQRILGILEKDFVGKNAFDFIHEDDRQLVLAEFGRLADQKSIKIPAFRFINGDGQYRWIETIVTDMQDDPFVGGIVANSRDVTERIENEMKIQLSVERYNIVSKATSDAIWDWDVSAGIVIWNKAIKGLFGYKHNIFTRDWWEERVHPADLARVSKRMRDAIKTKKSRLKIEYRFRCANDSYKNILDRSFLIYNDAAELIRVIGSMEDITEREVYIQTVEAQYKHLQEIAWTQSHVVRAPLTNIMGIAELLSSGVDDKKTLKELTTHLANAAADLDSVIKEIVRKTEEIKLPTIH